MMTLRRIAIGLGWGVLALVCACSETTSDTEDIQSESLEYPIAWQNHGTYSRLGKSVRLVVRDAATLAQIPLGDIPVDFSSQMVLIAGLGPTPSSDIGIRITRVWEKEGRLRVQERQIHPGLEQQRGLNPASPWAAVVISRTDLNIEGYSPHVPKDLLSERSAFGGTEPPQKRDANPFRSR